MSLSPEPSVSVPELGGRVSWPALNRADWKVDRLGCGKKTAESGDAGRAASCSLRSFAESIGSGEEATAW